MLSRYNPSTSTLLSVHSDQNILFHSLKSATISRQVIGYNDEIIDSIFLSPPPSAAAPSSSTSAGARDAAIAFATNSSLIRVYSTSTYDARLLAGHSDMVLCLDKSKDGEWLVSGSKDRTARVWACLPTADGADRAWRCIAVCEGHAESVGAVAVSRKLVADEALARAGIRANFLFTASQDRTIKMWDLTAIDLSSPEPTKLKSLLTQKIHEKDINSLDISPNDRMLATGSQDKTVKVFQVEFTAGKKGGKSAGAVNQVGTCKGHKRGVWSVKFSKTDKVLATASGDKTVRVWSLDDFSCLKVRARIPPCLSKLRPVADTDLSALALDVRGPLQLGPARRLPDPGPAARVVVLGRPRQDLEHQGRGVRDVARQPRGQDLGARDQRG